MEPFVRALGERHDLPEVQIIGGNAAAALLHEQTVIDLAAHTICAPAACDLPRLRVDDSLRDLDTLVLSTDPTEIEAVRLVGEQTIAGELKLSVFGLKTLDDLERQRNRPLHSTAKVFLGDRYVATSPDDPREPKPILGFKALYPFQAPIETDSMGTFDLCIDGRIPVPTSHPGATILNYLTRSISGLRAKDRTKVEAMTENILTRYPDVEAWIVEGPGRDMLDLARILQTLAEPRGRAQTLRLGTRLEIVPYTWAELDQHPGFLASERSRAVRRMIIESAHLKSRLLARFEAQSTLVTFWQNHVEERIGSIIHNDA